MAGRNLLVYYQRWQALDALIVSTYNTYAAVPAANFPRQATILDLLLRLQDFAAGQFQLFYYGFEPNDPQRTAQDPLLQPWDIYPPEDILTGILLQIGHDLDLIQHIAGQRMLNSPVARTTLANADELVWCALAPAVNHGFIAQPSGALTYFQKAAMFYSIPYADVAVIAVPDTATMAINPGIYPGYPAQQPDYRDYLAIPHEAGHYVYRHMLPAARAAREAARQATTIPADYQQWVRFVFEEMCADIYGCLVGGPVMAMDFESLALENSDADFMGNDGLHPNPALRPLIYCLVLANPEVRRLTRDDWQAVAGLLAGRWHSRLVERHVEDYNIKIYGPAGQTQTIQTQPHAIASDLIPVLPSGGSHGPLGDVVKNVVEALIKAILTFINPGGTLPDPHDLDGWSGDVDNHTQPDHLFNQFTNWIILTLQSQGCIPPVNPPIEPTVPPALTPWPMANHTSPTWLGRLSPGDQALLAAWQAAPTEPVPAGEVKDPDNMTPATEGWGHILYADGWTTDGPSDNNSGHPLD